MVAIFAFVLSVVAVFFAAIAVLQTAEMCFIAAGIAFLVLCVFGLLKQGWAVIAALVCIVAFVAAGLTIYLGTVCTL